MGINSCGQLLIDQGNFFNTGLLNWDTTAKTANFTAVNGNGYFVNTTSTAITVTLPAGSVGDFIGVSDYASTSNINSITISPNGTDKINGTNDDFTMSVSGIAVSLLYIDSTRGWKAVASNSKNIIGSSFISATGGTVTTCGDYKTHVFTGPGTFCVSAGSGACAVAEYLVVAGGGGGGDGAGPPYNFKQFGGGGAGGFRTFYSCGTANPLSGPAAIPISVQAYPVTVGSGGAGAPTSGVGTNGSNSIFSTITSTGGGAGQTEETVGNDGGSGAGGGGRDGSRLGGTGNTPPVSPSQGNNGGGGSGSSGSSDNGGGGGGGAGAVGGGGGPVYGTSSLGGVGGDGSYVSDAFFGSPAPSYGESGPVSSTRYFAGGAGGGNHTLYGPQAVRPGGVGGGGDGGPSPTTGSTNMGGGGGGGKAGGSGIVVIRYKFQ